MRWFCMSCNKTAVAEDAKHAQIDAAWHQHNIHPPEVAGFRAWSNVPIRDVWDDPNVW